MRYIISSVLSMLAVPALADVPRVITDIPPVYGLVATVMGDLGQPVLLLNKGAGAHDFQLRPSQMVDIAGADLAVWIGPQMTPWFERALGGADEDLTSLVLMDAAGTHLQEFGVGTVADKDDDGHDDDGHDDHGHDDHGHNKPEHDEHGHEDQGHNDSGHDDHAGHGHDGTDPHAWLTPENAAPWLDAIVAALSAADAENAAIYAANANAAKAEIAALDIVLAAALAPVKDQGFVAYHDAYGYFAAHYGLAYKGAVAMGDATTAGAAHLREVQATIADDVVCVFPESQHDSELLLQLIAGTQVKAGAALDPEGAMLDPAPTNYADVLRNMTAALIGCLGGA